MERRATIKRVITTWTRKITQIMPILLRGTLRPHREFGSKDMAKSDLQQRVWWIRAFVIGSWLSLMYFAYFWFVHEWGHSILNIPRVFILSRKNAGLVGSRLGTRRSSGAVLWELVLLQLRLRPELSSTEAALEALPGAAHLPLSCWSQHPAKE